MKTKVITLTAIISTTLMMGCEYEAPLTTDHAIPVDLELPGLWEEVPESGSEPEGNKMMVLQYSDTGYLIHYPCSEDGIYYRGYPIKIRGVEGVQLEAVGTKDGPVESDEKALYHVAAYSITNGVLEVRMLNTNVVDHDLKTTEDLQKAFLENINNKELFEDDPGRFWRRKRER